MIDQFTLNAILACPSCRFADNQVSEAANMAIGFMLVVLFGVLSGFIALIIKFARGERQAYKDGHI